MTSPTPDQDIKGEFRMRCRRLLSDTDEAIYISGNGHVVFISEVMGYIYSMLYPENPGVDEVIRLYKVEIVDGTPTEQWSIDEVRDIALPILRRHMVIDDLSDI